MHSKGDYIPNMWHKNDRHITHLGYTIYPYRSIAHYPQS